MARPWRVRSTTTPSFLDNTHVLAHSLATTNRSSSHHYQGLYSIVSYAILYLSPFFYVDNRQQYTATALFTCSNMIWIWIWIWVHWMEEFGYIQRVKHERCIRTLGSELSTRISHFGKRRYNERPQDLVAVLPDGITLSMASSFFWPPPSRPESALSTALSNVNMDE